MKPLHLAVVFLVFGCLLPCGSASAGPGAKALRPFVAKNKFYDSHGTRDTATGDYYEGRGYNWVNFEGQNPNHPSEAMREVSSGELQQLNGWR